MTGEGKGSRVMRRVPRQQRSREKVQHILAVAGELMSEIGYEAFILSPTKLFDRAAVTGGAFYAYFENLTDVADALAEQSMEECRRLADQFGDTPFASLDAACDSFLETFSAFYSRPVPYELWCRGYISRAMKELDGVTNQYIAERFRTVLNEQFELNLSQVTCIVAVEMSDHLSRYAYRNGDVDLEAKDKAKTAMRAFLSAESSGDGGC
ncbi:TetR/AcrR family transcriptional regulator [Mycobacterium sp. AZCC_0083]|jgi:AcrR family transcriptional regulator|uniref:TetR/AcrR family transcriptional regulator n=1 Tax=Mycobacterium sp. AZCC_0083 TaxID=2735882 RepID=UPI00161BBDBA|nr:TetR/AcrR family transcriptional regulator [Mycobacterium sp. AZCC_0083]MBB5163665.1 AcrR family transcriptional regulator [Mycobacterium sp. AZCC_0083]